MFGALLLESSSSISLRKKTHSKNHPKTLNSIDENKTNSKHSQFLGRKRKRENVLEKQARKRARPAGRRRRRHRDERKNNAKLFFSNHPNASNGWRGTKFTRSWFQVFSSPNLTKNIHSNTFWQSTVENRHPLRTFSLPFLPYFHHEKLQNKNTINTNTHLPPLFFKEGHVILTQRRKIRKILKQKKYKKSTYF